MRAPGLIIPLLAAVTLLGCQSAAPVRSREAMVPAGRYAEAFDAARGVLLEHEFELARVDARAGVITTLPRQWAGFMTPWIPHAEEPGSSVDGLLNHERRRVRVVFSPTAAPAPPGGGARPRTTGPIFERSTSP